MGIKIGDDAKVVVGAIVSGLIGGIAIATVWKFSPGKDAWDIATAIGTLAAAVIALFVSLWHQLLSSREKRARAIRSGARISGRLERAVDAAVSVSAHFAFSTETHTPFFFTSLSKTLGNAIAISLDDLLPLLEIPNQCAHRMATAFGLLEGISADLRGFHSGERWAETLQAERKAFLDRGALRASQARQLLNIAHRDFSRAIGASVRSPEIYELHDETE